MAVPATAEQLCFNNGRPSYITMLILISKMCSFVRIDMKAKHIERLKVVLHIIGRVLCMEWNKAVRISCPLSLAASKKPELGLLCGMYKITNIVGAMGLNGMARGHAR